MCLSQYGQTPKGNLPSVVGHSRLRRLWWEGGNRDLSAKARMPSGIYLALLRYCHRPVIRQSNLLPRGARPGFPGFEPILSTSAPQGRLDIGVGGEAKWRFQKQSLLGPDIAPATARPGSRDYGCCGFGRREGDGDPGGYRGAPARSGFNREPTPDNLQSFLHAQQPQSCPALSPLNTLHIK